jgi:hypothetical protein
VGYTNVVCTHTDYNYFPKWPNCGGLPERCLAPTMNATLARLNDVADESVCFNMIWPTSLPCRARMAGPSPSTPRDATPDRIHWLLNDAVWDTDAAMRVVVRDYVAEHLRDQPLVVAALDESVTGEIERLPRVPGCRRRFARLDGWSGRAGA